MSSTKAARSMWNKLAKLGSLVMGSLILFTLYWVSRYDYLLFHALVELLSVLVAWGIFAIAWNARRFHNNQYFLLLGIAHLFVGVIDIIHLFAYKGMNFFRGYDADLPTQLWIAGRYLQSVSMLIAPWFLSKPARSRVIFPLYLLLTVLIVWGIFSGLFPSCYLEGQGLTLFKKVSEYVISGLFLSAIVVHIRRRASFDLQVLRLLIASLATATVAELAFTLYVGVYDFTNLLGHLIKIVAVYFIYKAIIQMGLVHPHRLLLRDLKQREAALRWQAQELEAHNEELDAFAHTVAHDLNSPLSVLLGHAEMTQYMLGSLSGQELERNLQIMVQSGRRMVNIVHELLLLASVRKSDVHIEQLDMSTIVNQVRERLDYLIAERQAQVTVPEQWPPVLGYGPWIEEVWVNYISNALIYGGDPPQISLGITVRPDGMVRFWVQDKGPGIAIEDQKTLFTPFSQVSQAHTEGHGLGLSIVRRILLKLDGEFGVDSQLGQGSKFWFALAAVEKEMG